MGETGRPMQTCQHGDFDPSVTPEQTLWAALPLKEMESSCLPFLALGCRVQGVPTCTGCCLVRTVLGQGTQSFAGGLRRD